MHESGIVYRDVKPENFLLGLGKNQNKIYVIDMGLARLYRDRRGQHISMNRWNAVTGTARYMSINANEGIEQSRRDDLEALLHMIIYLIKGSLPWQGLPHNPLHSKVSAILLAKKECTLSKLCAGLPQQFELALDYTRSLEFSQEPDYARLKTLLRSCHEPHVSDKLDWSDSRLSALIDPLDDRTIPAEPITLSQMSVAKSKHAAADSDSTLKSDADGRKKSSCCGSKKKK